MRYLILSDIHSNWPALESVLADAAGSWDRAVCCGDLVGYGADPNKVIDWARTNLAAVVRGNHDKASMGSEDLEWFNPAARAAAVWTKDRLSPENATYLANLPRGPLDVSDFQLLHGSPLDEDEYLVNTFDAAHLSGYIDTPVSFFGHTHLQGGFLFHRNGVRRLEKPARHEHELALDLEPDSLYLVNPGSIGQPRDGDNRAAYCLYDQDLRAVFYRRVEYDIEQAQRRIIDAGLPDVLARRLGDGH